MNDEIDEFVLVHHFGVRRGDEKGDVITENRLTSQHHEIVRALRHEPAANRALLPGDRESPPRTL